MKIFLTSIDIIDFTGKYDYPENKSFNVYSTYERAKENGIDELKYLIILIKLFKKCTPKSSKNAQQNIQKSHKTY